MNQGFFIVVVFIFMFVVVALLSLKDSTAKRSLHREAREGR